MKAKFKIELDIATGEGKLFLYEKWINAKTKDDAWKPEDNPISTVSFEINRKARRIDVTSMDTDPRHKRQGYGRLLMRSLMALSEFYGLPLELDSTTEGEPFYHKIGMKDLGNKRFRWYPSKAKKWKSS